MNHPTLCLPNCETYPHLFQGWKPHCYFFSIQVSFYAGYGWLWYLRISHCWSIPIPWAIQPSTPSKAKIRTVILGYAEGHRKDDQVLDGRRQPCRHNGMAGKLGSLKDLKRILTFGSWCDCWLSHLRSTSIHCGGSSIFGMESRNNVKHCETNQSQQSSAKLMILVSTSPKAFPLRSTERCYSN